MSDLPSFNSAKASRFFDNYLTYLDKSNIPENQKRWYVKRIEEFIKAHKGHKLKTLSSTVIEQYFKAIGRKNTLSGWQFHQCINAIRILYCDFLITDEGKKVNWQYWLESAKQLDIDHPTTARQLTNEELTYIKEKKGSSSLQPIRSKYHNLLLRFTSEIRRRGYAYRTEQTYEQWLCRFILFYNNKNPEDLNSENIKNFLNYLANHRNVSSSRQAISAVC